MDAKNRSDVWREFSGLVESSCKEKKKKKKFTHIMIHIFLS